MKTKGYKHQIETVEWSNDKKHFAYLHEMGCGKSWCLLAHVERGFNRFDFDTLLLIAPKGIYRNWVDKEIPTHMSIPYDIYLYRSSMTDIQFKKMVKELDRPTKKLRIVIMNVEALGVSKLAKKFSMDTVKKFQCLIAIDESTTIKTPTSNRTDACLTLSEIGESHRVIMTGSPITKGPYDLYSQANFLNPNYLGFSSFLAYRNYYSEILTHRIGLVEQEDGTKRMQHQYIKGAAAWTPGTRQQYEKVLEYKNLDQLHEKIKPWSFRVLKKDCLDLPPKVYMTRDVELTKEQAKAYNEMSTEWITQYDAGLITATIALTRLMKLHQILCGHVKNDDGEVIIIPSHRISVLTQLLDEVSAKTIIWANYRQDVVNICTTLPLEQTVQYHGGVNDMDRKEAVERFQNDPNCMWFVGTTRTAGRGITLTAASNMIFYSYDYDRELRIQAEDRAHRIGQEEKLTITDIRAPGTIDDVILAAHKYKGMIADQIIEEAKVTLTSRL